MTGFEMSSKKLKYNRGLLAELRWIRDHAVEEDLEKTALHAFFRLKEEEDSEAAGKREGYSSAERGETRPPVRYQSASLNAEQRLAGAANVRWAGSLDSRASSTDFAGSNRHPEQ